MHACSLLTQGNLTFTRDENGRRKPEIIALIPFHIIFAFNDLRHCLVSVSPIFCIHCVSWVWSEIAYGLLSEKQVSSVLLLSLALLITLEMKQKQNKCCSTETVKVPQSYTKTSHTKVSTFCILKIQFSLFSQIFILKMFAIYGMLLVLDSFKSMECLLIVTKFKAGPIYLLAMLYIGFEEAWNSIESSSTKNKIPANKMWWNWKRQSNNLSW